jgi:hypothetical protein
MTIKSPFQNPLVATNSATIITTEFSKTLPRPTNAGGKFQKAEAPLWVTEDQAFWDAAAAVEEDVK